MSRKRQPPGSDSTNSFSAWSLAQPVIPFLLSCGFSKHDAFVNLLKAEFLKQPLGGRVRGAHLEFHHAISLACKLGEGFAHQKRGQPLPPLGSIHVQFQDPSGSRRSS